jgi:S-layer homology domain
MSLNTTAATTEPVRRSRRARKALAAAAGAALLSTATIGMAHASAGLFSDVPTDHPFFWDIQWLASTGITTGYEDGTFRPEEPVTRQAMAAFLHRYHDLDDTIIATPETAGPDIVSSDDWVQLPGASVEFSVPVDMTGTLLATFSAESACYGAAGFCRARVMVDDPATGAPGPVELGPEAGGFAFDSTDNGTETSWSWESHSMQRVGELGDGSETWVAWVEVSTFQDVDFRLDDWVLSVEVDVHDPLPVVLES